MKIMALVFSILMGFSFENIGENSFSANEIFKMNLKNQDFEFNSSVVFTENVSEVFNVKNFGLILSKSNDACNAKLGVGNFQKSNLYFQKLTPGFSFGSDFLMSSKSKSENFLSLSGISDEQQPFGIGISINGKKFFTGFSLFSLSKDFFDKDLGNHFCFANYGFSGKIENINFYYLLDTTLGYGFFSENQKKSAWFSENKYIPVSSMPVLAEKLFFQFKFGKNYLKSGSEIRFCDSVCAGIKVCFWNETDLKIKILNLKLGILFSEFDFPLLNNKYLNKDFEAKINPNISLGKSDFGISAIVQREKRNSTDKNPSIKCNSFDVNVDFGILYSLNEKNFGVKIQVQSDDLLIFPDSIFNNHEKINFENWDMFINSEANIEGKIDFYISRFSLSLEGKINLISDVSFWENSKNQYDGKIGFSFDENHLKIDSDLYITYKKNKLYSEKIALEIGYKNLKLKTNLEIQNELFYQKFFKKNAEKSGINFGISGTINL